MNDKKQNTNTKNNEKYDSVLVKITKDSDKFLSLAMLVDNNSLFKVEIKEDNNEYSKFYLYRKSEDVEYDCIINGVCVNTAYPICITFKERSVSIKCEHIIIEKKLSKRIFKSKHIKGSGADYFDYVRLSKNESKFKILISFENSSDVRIVFNNSSFIKDNIFKAMNMNIKSVKIRFDDNSFIDDLYRFICDMSSALWSGQSSFVRDYLHNFKYDMKISSVIIDSNSIIINNNNNSECMIIEDSIPFVVMTRMFNIYNIDFAMNVNFDNIKTITVRNF